MNKLVLKIAIATEMKVNKSMLIKSAWAYSLELNDDIVRKEAGFVETSSFKKAEKEALLYALIEGVLPMVSPEGYYRHMLGIQSLEIITTSDTLLRGLDPRTVEGWDKNHWKLAKRIRYKHQKYVADVPIWCAIYALRAAIEGRYGIHIEVTKKAANSKELLPVREAAQLALAAAKETNWID